MNLEVRRQAFSPHSTIGQLFIDGQVECVTLEPPSLPPGDIRKPRAIMIGTYNVMIRWSTKFGKHVPHVENVPSFTAIEIHVGNAAKDTDGCTLVGTQAGPGPDWISHSVVAWTHLMSKMMAVARLLNPDEKSERSHIWDVGQITYSF
jgi:hypothetical protein